MARRDGSPDFIEALARGLDVIRAFQPHQPVMSLTAVASAAGLARPTARRVLLTQEHLGYARSAGGGFELTPRVLDLGMSYVLSRNLWDVARPHMECLVARTGESSSIAQLDGPDIVYVARVAVPKIIALAVTIGTRFPAMPTSLGKVLLAALPPGTAEQVLAEPGRSGITARWQPGPDERAAELREVRAGAHGRAARRGIRSGRPADWTVIAALKVSVHAADTRLDPHRPIPAAATPGRSLSAPTRARQAAPYVTAPQRALSASRADSRLQLAGQVSGSGHPR